MSINVEKVNNGLDAQVSFRHSESVEKFTDIQVKEENFAKKADFHRKVYNAGLKSLYGKKIESNVIVN